MKKHIITALTLAAFGCGGGGGASKGSSTVGKAPPPPPPPTKKDDGKAGTPEVKREVSKEEKKDYESAIGYFNENDKKGSWSADACKSAAEKFASVVRSHPTSVEAQYMVGLSYHRCNMDKQAVDAYQAAVKMKATHGQSLSNLGEIYYRQGQVPEAKKYWESAINANGKLVAARNNFASYELDEMRKLTPATDKDGKKWKELEEDARLNLSNTLGVDAENVKAYTLYGLVYMEGYQKNKNRLDLAKLLLDEAAKRNPKFAPLENAYGLYYMHRNLLNDALKHFQAVVELDGKFVEARMNVGLTTLGFRRYDIAKEQFTKVIEIQPKNYDAVIGLGVAYRGNKELENAEKQYLAAIGIDKNRGEAYYNLAVLLKDFRATKQKPEESIPTLRKAQGYFKDFIAKGGHATDVAEAKEQVTLIDKTVAMTEKFIKDSAAAAAAAAKQPPPPAPAPAPAPAPKP